MRIRIFEYWNYKLFVEDIIGKVPNESRGKFTRMAESARTHKATISQIFRGDKHLTLEQAVLVAKFLGLGPAETKYFILLVEYARAGSEELKSLFHEQIRSIKESQDELSKRLISEKKLTEHERAVFYSSWIYSGIRVLSSISGFHSREQICRRLKLPLEIVARAVEFLIENGLCIEKAGKLMPGPQSTYLESTSPLISRHHGNWRVKAMESHPILSTKEELCYTAPLSVSSKDVLRIRELLARSIESIDSIVAPSPCERFFCLNMDWFEVR